MYNIFLNTCNNKLIIILSDEHDVLVSELIIDATQKQSEYASKNLTALLDRFNIKYNQIDSFYLINGPGSYTGIRVGIIIVKAFKLLNLNLKVYTMNILQFLSQNEKMIVISPFNKSKCFFGVFQKNKVVIETQILPHDLTSKIIEDLHFKNFKILDNRLTLNLNYFKIWFKQKKHFNLIKNLSELKPFYLQPSI